jgi:hypothetical protein
VLLVDADHAEARDGREDRGACADHDRRFAARDACTLVASLRLGERGVQHGDALAEARAKASERLRSERDLRDEHDRPAPTLESRRARLQVDLGLAAAGGAVEEEVRGRTIVEGRNDSRQRRLLRCTEGLRFRFARQRVALGRLRPLASRLPLHRRHQRQCAPGRRAVVVGDPERQLDERARQLFDHSLDGGCVDPHRRLNVDLRYHTTPACVAEANLDHRTWADVFGNLVGELARERTRGHERIDGGVASHAVHPRAGMRR